MPSNFGQSRGQVIGLGIGSRYPINTKTVVRVKPQRWIISGVTKDYLGVALGSCVLECHISTQTDATRILQTAAIQDGEPRGRLVNGVTSHPTTGAYKMEVNSVENNRYNIDAYLTGSPDRAGTTVNTLTKNLDTDPY